eukprot:8470579-Heterocapsa_arctica.AAC.1
MARPAEQAKNKAIRQLLSNQQTDQPINKAIHIPVITASWQAIRPSNPPINRLTNQPSKRPIGQREKPNAVANPSMDELS